MKNYYIDTSCLISFLTDRDIDQQKRVTPYIEDAARQKHNVVLTQNAITECVYVLSSVYKIPDSHVSHMLSAMAQTPGLIKNTQLYLLEVVLFWPADFRDYGDAVLAAAAKNNNGIVLTFDQRFYRECIDADIQAYIP